MRLTRLAGAVVAAALIVVGVLLASRPVSDEQLRAHATDRASGVIVATRNTWDGSQLLTVTWWTGSGQRFTTNMEDFNGAWQVGFTTDVLFDPFHPTTDAVLAFPSWTFARDFRTDAVFQAIVPFTLAGIVLALAVIWPADPFLFGDRARRARRSLVRYVLTPAVLCAIAVTGSVLIQDQRASAQSLGADKIVGWLSVVLMLLLIWPYFRAVQYYRLRQLLTVPDDAVAAASVTSIAGRRLALDTVHMVALAGQRTQEFRSGDQVRLYGRWERRGPALITDGQKVLIGFAKRTVPAALVAAAPGARESHSADPPADVLAEPLIRQYPELNRRARLVLVSPVVVLVIVVGASIVILAAVGTRALGPLWLAWLLSAPVIGGPIWRYRQLSRLLQLPHVARHGVVTNIATSRRGASIPIIAMSADRTIRLRLIGTRQDPGIAVDQEVILMQLPTPSNDSAVLITEGGRVALAVATAVQAQDAAAVGPAS